LKIWRCMTLSEEPLQTPRIEPGLQGTQFVNVGRKGFFEFLILSCVVVRTVTGTLPLCRLPAFRRFSQNCEKRPLDSSGLSAYLHGTRLPFINCCYQLMWGWICWNLQDKKEDLDCVDFHGRMPSFLAKWSRRIFIKFDIWVFFENLSRKFEFQSNLTWISVFYMKTLYCTFMIVSRSIVLRISNVSGKNCRENQNTHHIFNTYFLKNRVVYQIMRKNMVQPDRPQMTMRRIHFVC
jgi:hypothetical protein